jgi:hypothetical protein
MSYCRFSNDDFMCDVYVYQSDSAFVTHVAGRRRVYSVELPPPVELHGGFTDEQFKAWYDRHNFVLNAPHELVPIGLPHDGESFNDEDAAACADRLESLRKIGYNVPQDAIDALREESACSEGSNHTEGT